MNEFLFLIGGTNFDLFLSALVLQMVYILHDMTHFVTETFHKQIIIHKSADIPVKLAHTRTRVFEIQVMSL